MRLIYTAVLLLLLQACKEVTFREPQPKGRKPLTSVPKNLQGKYVAYQENGDLARDTIIVTARGYRFGYFSPDQKALSDNSEYDDGVLSDSLILKSYKGYYFLNFNENPEWMLRVIRQEKNGDIVYMAPEQENVDFSDYLKKLSTELKLDSSQVNNKMLYQIDPSPNKLIELIEQGYFSKVTLRKVKE